MQGDFKRPVAVYHGKNILICKRYTEEHNQLFEGFNNNYRSREHEYLFYYILYSSYCLMHVLQNRKRSFQNCTLCDNFLHEALSCSLFHLKTVIFCYLTWLGPPEENIFIKNAVALYFYAEDNKLYVFCDRERKNFFIHLKTVSNVLSVTLLVKVFLCQLLTVSRDDVTDNQGGNTL